MRSFTVHAAPADAQPRPLPELVPEGFSLLAALLPPVWLLLHRQWLALVAFLAVAALMSVLLPPAVLAVAMPAVHLLVGLQAQDIRRYGSALVPMDEALVEAAIDISGRPFLAWDARFTRDKVGEMDTELFEEFFRAFAMNAGITLHVTQKAGTNAHHIAEGCFKALARALRMAVEPDPRMAGAIPSTKGSLEG